MGMEKTLLRQAKLDKGFVEAEVRVLTDTGGKMLSTMPRNYQRDNKDGVGAYSGKAGIAGPKAYQYGHEVSYDYLAASRDSMTAQEIQDSISRYEGNMFLGSSTSMAQQGLILFKQRYFQNCGLFFHD